jgi:hypothetical protein
MCLSPCRVLPLLLLLLLLLLLSTCSVAAA